MELNCMEFDMQSIELNGNKHEMEGNGKGS